MSAAVEAFPLSWPDGWPRKKGYRQSAPYRVQGDKARIDLLHQLRLMGAVDVVISSNVPLRLDGQPRADAAKKHTPDPGVAVYFRRKAGGERQVIACDKWAYPDQNIRAIGLCIEALRAMERSGASELLDRAFTGFKALPPAGATSIGSEGAPWWQVLGLHDTSGTGTLKLEDAKSAYRRLAAQHHPDRGGDAGAMAAINRAWEQAQAALGAQP